MRLAGRKRQKAGAVASFPSKLSPESQWQGESM